MAIIQDSATGLTAKVSVNNRLQVHSITTSEASTAATEGDGYNINTGLITLTDAAESGVLYIQNNEDRDLQIEFLEVILAPSTGGVVTDTTRVRVYRNPTGGTLISGAVLVSNNQNRNFGTNRTLTADAYKGATGNTVTGGNIIVEVFVNPGERELLNIDMTLTKGDSVAVSYEPNDSNTSMKCMVDAAVHIGHIV